MRKYNSKPHYGICVRNDGYPASLELRKIYQLIPDAKSSRHLLVRVIDESGEDYLYPADYFVQITVPEQALKVFA